MRPYHYSTGTIIDPGDLSTISNGLVAYNAEATGSDSYRELTVLARDSTAALIGGLNGWTLLDAYTISFLWVASEHRARGVGEQLIRHSEREAVARGCAQCFVDTFSFQARGFYERQGFQVVSVVESYIAGHARYTLRKIGLTASE